MKYCPCGTNKRYLECCGAYLQKKEIAPTPEALMRSRYSAYVEDKLDFIRRTMRGEALLNFSKKKAKEKVTWLGLEVLSSSFETHNPLIGYVEFKAKYKVADQIRVMHEKSEFHKIDDRWYYTNAIETDNQSDQ